MRYRTLIVCLVGFSALARAQDEHVLQLLEQADAQDRAGDFVRASVLYRDAVRISENSHDWRLPRALAGLADTSDEIGRYQDAERFYRRALRLLEGTAGKQSPSYAAVAVNLGIHYTEVQQPDKAKEMLRDSVAILARALPRTDGHLAMARNCLALLLMDDRKFDEAQKQLDEALLAIDIETPPDPVHRAVVLCNLGALRRLQVRYGEAVDFFARAIVVLEDTQGRDHPLLIRPLNNLAMVYIALGNREDAEAAFRRALAITELRMGPQNPLCGKLLLNYAECERKFGNKKEAKSLESRAKAVLGDNALVNGAGLTVDAKAFRAPSGPRH